MTDDEEIQRERRTFRRLAVALGLLSVFAAMVVLAMAYRLLQTLGAQ